jgi:hypothetical protein
MARRTFGLVLFLSAAGCSDIPPNHDTEKQCGCVAEPVSLSAVDSPFQGTTTIAPCRTFRLDMGPIADRPASSCTMPMMCPAQDGGINGVDLAVALRHPDVQDAVRAGAIHYGAGPGTPGGGGPVYVLRVGSAEFEVGGPCGTESPCTPVPTGIRALLTALLTVNDQELRRSPCREMLSK